MGEARAFAIALKSNLDCTRVRGLRLPFALRRGFVYGSSLPAAPTGPAPTGFGRQRHRTGIVARRSSDDLAPTPAVENSVHEAVQDLSGVNRADRSISVPVFALHRLRWPGH